MKLEKPPPRRTASGVQARLAAILPPARADLEPLPDLARALSTPAEPVTGEDPVERFEQELAAVSAVFHRCPAGAAGAVVRDILAAAGATTAVLADDLGRHGGAVGEALLAGGVTTTAYADAARDRDLLAAVDASVTGCLIAIAASGSIVTTAAAGRGAALVPPLHVCVVEREQLVVGLADALRRIRTLAPGSMFALQSGPSRSADIEKTLILGVHGPAATHVVLVDDER